MENSDIIYYIVFGVVGVVALFIKYAKSNEPKELYTYKNETHDLETWRKRGMESLKNKGQKTRLKYCETAQVVGMIYIFLGWELTKCE